MYKVALRKNLDTNYLNTRYINLRDAISDCIAFGDKADLCVTDWLGNILYPADKVSVIGFSLEAYPLELK